MELLEHHIRDDMNRRSARTMVVLRPVKVVITNLPEGHVEQLEALVRPDIKENEKYGTYKVRNQGLCPNFRLTMLTCYGLPKSGLHRFIEPAGLVGGKDSCLVIGRACGFGQFYQTCLSSRPRYCTGALDSQR
jgi:hypothetical protein